MGPRGIKLGTIAAGLVVATSVWASAPAEAKPLPVSLPQQANAANPTPLTDLFASLLPPLTGGTQRICATSGLGIAVHCVEHTTIQPSLDPAASGTTFADWIYCKNVCTGGLLAHEMVHVRQFETTGDTFGPLYLAEAALHGDGCDNKYEREAYGPSCP